MALTRVLAATLALALAGAPVRAETPEEVRALESAARAGDAAAALRLGTIHDFGLGVPRDAARALRWFLDAAEGGSVPAMFNVAVMLDFGTGQLGRDAAGAALWYARAGLRGHDRARYNLGLLYESGEGVPHDPGMAAHWFSAAAGTIPAAADRAARLSAMPVAPGAALTAPRIGFLDVSGGFVEAVWTAPARHGGAQHVVEIAVAGPEGAEAPIRASTGGSALRVKLPPGLRPLGARVVALDPDRRAYAASGWTVLTPGAEPPSGATVRISVPPGDPAARALAETIARDLRAGGLDATLAEAETGRAATTLSVGFDTDIALAEAIGASLPGPVQVSRDATAAWPGEITLHLVMSEGDRVAQR